MFSGPHYCPFLHLLIYFSFIDCVKCRRYLQNILEQFITYNIITWMWIFLHVEWLMTKHLKTQCPLAPKVLPIQPRCPLEKMCPHSRAHLRPLSIFQFGQETKKICTPKVTHLFWMEKISSKHSKNPHA